MKKLILPLIGAILTTGCSSVISPRALKALGEDKAFVTIHVKTFNGEGTLVRDGRPNSGNSVADGSLNVSSVLSTNVVNTASKQLTQQQLSVIVQEILTKLLTPQSATNISAATNLGTIHVETAK